MEGNHHKTLIAMKGHPFTGKTSVAKAIAMWLRLPILFLDDMVETLSPAYCSNTPPSQQEAEYLHDLALDMACRIAKAQLETVKERHHCVIIDCSLSSQSQLDRLIRWAMAVRVAENKLRLLIIECYRENKYGWEFIFEKEHKGGRSGMAMKRWYKPASWDDVEQTVKVYEASGLDDYFNYNIEISSRNIDISKLVVDPFTDVREVDLMVDVASQASHLPPLFEAVEYLITHEKQEDEPSTMVFKNWWLAQRSKLGKGRCKTGHSLTKYIPEAEVGLLAQGQFALCGSCEDQVTEGAAYACEFCSLTLHKACAELIGGELRNNVLNRIVYYEPPEEGGSYRFPMRYACSFCKEEGKEYCYGCESCVFESHLKSRWLPTIVHIEGHEHHLSIQLNRISEMPDAYTCEACGIVGFQGSYCCKICDLHYHSECVTIPTQVQYKHEGYDHPMVLVYGEKEEFEDYLCSVCCQKRDPKIWFYYCEDCDYPAHPFCVLQKRYMSIFQPFSELESD